MGAILFLIIGLSIQLKGWVAWVYWTFYGFYLIFHLVRLCAIYSKE